MNQIFDELLYFREKYLSKIRGFYHEGEIIKVLTGVRRCGKSSILKMIVRELLSQGVKEENILFFNLDRRPYTTTNTAEQLLSLIHISLRRQRLYIDRL